jgi:hypothetical protein
MEQNNLTPEVKTFLRKTVKEAIDKIITLPNDTDREILGKLFTYLRQNSIMYCSKHNNYFPKTVKDLLRNYSNQYEYIGKLLSAAVAEINNNHFRSLRDSLGMMKSLVDEIENLNLKSVCVINTLDRIERSMKDE